MKNLRKLRTERNLSQQKLAEEFNLSQQSIYKYENNLAEPDIQTLKNFASFFHTTVDYLIDYTPSRVTSSQNTSQPNIPMDKTHLLFLYQQLKPDTKKHLIAILEELSKVTH